MSDSSQTSDDPFHIPGDRTDEPGLGDHLWVKLSEALRFLGRFKKVLEPQDPQEALLSALRSGLVTSQCEVLQRIDHALTISNTRDLAAAEWAEVIHLNFWDDAINLRDGTPVKQIEVSKYGLYDWLSNRGHDDPDYLFSDFNEFAEENGFALTSSAHGQVTAIELTPMRKNKGGRPFKYDWASAYLKVLIRNMYVEGRLTGRSREVEVISMLRSAFAASGIEDGPQDSVLKDHAILILAELRAADAA